MTSVVTGIGVCCAVSLNVATVLVQQTPPPPNPKPPVQASAKATEAEITVTGCLVQGSAPTVFVLQNAKRDPQNPSEKAARYVVAPATEDLFLKEHVNHQVRILGTPDGKPQPTPAAGRPVDEKAIPRLNAKGLTMVTASCVTAAGGGGWDDAEAEAAGEDGPRHVGPRKDRGGSIALSSGGGAGFFGAGAPAGSSGGRAGGRFFLGGPYGFFGGIGFARTSSVTGEGDITSGLTSEESDLEQMLDWIGEDSGVPSGFSPSVDGPTPFFAAPETAEPVDTPALEALVEQVTRTTVTELLGEDAVPVAAFDVAPAVPDSRIVNPEPGTLLLIATGLLLVVYAGRRREWTAFRRRVG